MIDGVACHFPATRLCLEIPILMGMLVTHQFVKAQSVPVARESIETEIPQVRVYKPLPAGFDYYHASTADLARYGLPERPDKRESPGAFEIWEGLARQAQKRLGIGTLQKTEIYNKFGPPKGMAVEENSNQRWSGWAIVDGSGQFARNYTTVVVGNTTVPSSLSGCGNNGPAYTFLESSWVGLDGADWPDVLQTGVTSELDCSRGIGVYPWIEWFPAPSIRITSLAFRRGDGISMAAWVVNSGDVPHYVLGIHNSTLNLGETFDIAPSSAQFKGTSVEWIVERPSHANLVPYLLPNYDHLGWIMSAYTQTAAGAVPIIYRPSVGPTGVAVHYSMCQNEAKVSIASFLGSGPHFDRATFRYLTQAQQGEAGGIPCPLKDTRARLPR